MGDVGTALRFDSVSVRVDDTEILHEVSADIARGSVTALVGPSGSGKSTLLRLCNRLGVPTSGAVLRDGVDIATLDVCTLRRDVGMIFQRPTMLPGTVADNLRVADPDLDDAAVEALLGRVGLEPAASDADGATLSGGEAQRACIARTLATGPSVLLADEATSALDEAARDRIELLVRSFVDDGLTVVWVTHDMAQARRMADHRIRLDAGRLA